MIYFLNIQTREVFYNSFFLSFISWQCTHWNVVENVSIDYGGVAIACTTEWVYALENYKNDTSLWRTIQVNGKIKLSKNAYGYDLL
jgi:hypothetical protein